MILDIWTPKSPGTIRNIHKEFTVKIGYNLVPDNDILEM